MKRMPESPSFMQCPSCSHENRATARFCEQCGEPLARSCGSCGTELRRSALSGRSNESADSLARRPTRETRHYVPPSGPSGSKYVVEGRIEGPSGRSAMVLSVWIIDHGSDAPRLVTAYPSEEQE